MPWGHGEGEKAIDWIWCHASHIRDVSDMHKKRTCAGGCARQTFFPSLPFEPS